MEINESKIAIFVLAGLVAGSLGCSACIGTEGTDGCIEYNPSGNEILNSKSQIIQQKDPEYEVRPMYGVPEKPAYKKRDYSAKNNYDWLIKPKTEKEKMESQRRGMMLLYAPPTIMNK